MKRTGYDQENDPDHSCIIEVVNTPSILSVSRKMHSINNNVQITDGYTKQWIGEYTVPTVSLSLSLSL